MSYAQQVAVTKSDTLDIRPGFVAWELWIGTAGDGTLRVTAETGEVVNYTSIPAGRLPIRVKRVHATGSGVSNIVAWAP
jgi:hypothetical protein